MPKDIILCIFGDIHGDWDTTNKIMEKEPANLYLCAGDISDANYQYSTLNRPLWTLYGNHENWDIVASCQENKIRVGNLNFIYPGKTYEINGIRFGGLGGNYSPKFYTYQRKNLPFPRNKDNRNGKADKRRHFVEEEVNLCKEKLCGLDIFLTHEAPSFYRKNMRFSDQGSGEIIDDLVKTIKPKLHVWGHHHRYFTGFIDNIKSIGLAYPKVSYLKINLTQEKIFLIETQTGMKTDEV